MGLNLVNHPSIVTLLAALAWLQIIAMLQKRFEDVLYVRQYYSSLALDKQNAHRTSKVPLKRCISERSQLVAAVFFSGSLVAVKKRRLLISI